ncbi:hypothetical protein pb186bvf_006790 [Paramecium bursaria]
MNQEFDIYNLEETSETFSDQPRQVESYIYNELPKERQIEMIIKLVKGAISYYENIQYTIKSKQQDKEQHEVVRTFSDFEWLYDILFDNYPGIIIPAIPQKSVLAKLNIVEQTSQIRDRRFYQLKEFLTKISLHKELWNTKEVILFFEGSYTEIQEEKEKFKKFQPYARQISAAVVNTGYNVFGYAKGSLKYLSSFISSQQVCNQRLSDFSENPDMSSLFYQWDDVLTKEHLKLKKINDAFDSTIKLKLDQCQELQKIITNLQNTTFVIEGNFNNKLYGHYQIEFEQLNLVRQLYVYKLDLYVLDIEQALKIIKLRAEIIQKLHQSIKYYNEGNDKERYLLFYGSSQEDRAGIQHGHQRICSLIE